MRLRRAVLIIGTCLAVFGGVFWARIVLLDSAWWVLWLLPLFLASLRRHGVIALLCLAIMGFGLGWWRGSVFVHKLNVHRSYHYQKVTVIGKALDDAVYGKQYQLEFTMGHIQVLSPAPTPLVGSLTVRGFGEPAIYRGDIVRVTGKVYPTLGNNLGTISFADLQVMERGDYWLDQLRREFAAGIQSALPEPAASFALGILIGQRTTLPEEVDEQLRHVGLTHIIAVSGYNLTIIVIACRRLLARFSKFQATAACLLLIVIFLAITGSSPPIVRASIISMLSIATWYYGRSMKPVALLLTAAAVTVIANPLYLWGNVSWYLSFLAFFGVLVLAPLIVKRFFGGKEPGLVKGVILESTCANVLVLPYVLYIFGSTSLVSLPANLAVVPLIPLAMLCGLVAGLGGMILPALVSWVAWPANLLLTYMLDIAQLLSRVPHAYAENISFSWQAMAFAYATIGGVMLVLFLRTKPNLKPQAFNNPNLSRREQCHADQKQSS